MTALRIGFFLVGFVLCLVVFWFGYMLGISHVVRADAEWCIKAAQETNLCEAVTSKSMGQISQQY